MKYKYFLILLTAFSIFNAANELDPLEILKEYISIDTVNPPGNESNAVEFLGDILKDFGIEYKTYESAPGRGNLIARINGGDMPALILMHHTDVVPFNAEYWISDPMVAEEINGYLYGRGVIDMKGLGVQHLMAFLDAFKNKEKLNRDIIFMATADEEAGGLFGVGWLIDNHPEVFDGAGYVLNEGGSGLDIDGQKIFNVEVTQKVPVWLKLTAEGVPGHGSMPRKSSAVIKILKALNALNDNPFTPRIIPPVDEYFKSLAMDMNEPEASLFKNLARSVKNKKFIDDLQDDNAALHALTRDTCSITMLKGSSKINVIPPTASAEVDCRMLPDREVKEFLADFKNIVEPFDVDVQVLLSFKRGVSSRDSSLYKTIEKVTSELYKNSKVIPSVATGFTDSHFTRDLGIESYGFNPTLYPAGEARGIHGNNERVSIKLFRQSTADLTQIVQEFTQKKNK